MKFWKSIGALACSAVLSAQLSASTIYVDEFATGPVHNGTSWCTAYKTLSAALAAASAGDVIKVAGGLYTPDPILFGDPREATFKLVSNVRIEGAYAGCGAPNPDARDYANDISFIRGDPPRDDHITGDTSNNSYHVLTAWGVSDAELDGLYVDGGHADNPLATDGSKGAGVLAHKSSFTAVNCIFQGNEAIDWPVGLAGRGGSVYARSSKLHFVDTLFRESIAGERGGGVYSEASSLIYDDCTFAACITGGDGGGAYNDAGSYAEIRGAWFLVCSAIGNGGSLHNDGAQVLVARSRFQGSNATHGAGIYSVAASLDLVNCELIWGNNASTDGGALFGKATTTTLMNCLITGNDAGGVGGAIAHHDAKLVITNSTLEGNTAGSGAAGVDVAGSGGVKLTNSILWNNSTGGVVSEATQVASSGGASISVNYSDVDGWTGLLGGVGNFGLDPLFIAPGALDYRLGALSPCRNAGNNAALPSDIADLDGDSNVLEATPLDLDLAPRIQAGTVDMGAYEAAP
jgi:hypothetical protein